MASLKRTVIGVEIGAQEIRLVEMRAGNPPQVIRAGFVPLPPNAMDGDRIVQVDSVADLLRGLYTRLGCQAKAVVIGMGPQSVVTRVLDIPRVPDSELRVVLEGELTHYQILRAGAGAFDYFRLHTGTGHTETLPTVLLMATEDRVAQGFRVVVERAGLQFLALEPISMALFRAAHPLARVEPATLCLAIMPSRSELSILEQGQIRLYRRLDQGSNDFIKGRRTAASRIPGTTDLSVELGIPQRQPRRMMLNNEEEDEGTSELAAGDVPTSELQRGGGTGNLPPEAGGMTGGKVIPQAAASFGGEVQRSLDYYNREFPNATKITSVVLTSNDPEAADIASWLSQSLHLDVRVVEPPLNETMPMAIQTLLKAPQGLQYLGALGLALQAVTADTPFVPRFNLATTGSAKTAPLERDRLTAAMIGAVCILTGGFFSGLIIARNANGVSSDLDRLKQQYALNEKDYAVLNKQIQDKKALNWIVKSDNLPIPAIVSLVTQDMPYEVGLKNLQIERNGHIALDGAARSLEQFDNYYLNLKNCPHFVGTRAQTITTDPLTQITTFRIEMALKGTQAEQKSGNF